MLVEIESNFKILMNHCKDLDCVSFFPRVNVMVNIVARELKPLNFLESFFHDTISRWLLLVEPEQKALFLHC
jgi:hypothetical protein